MAAGCYCCWLRVEGGRRRPGRARTGDGGRCAKGGVGQRHTGRWKGRRPRGTKGGGVGERRKWARHGRRPGPARGRQQAAREGQVSDQVGGSSSTCRTATRQTHERRSKRAIKRRERVVAGCQRRDEDHLSALLSCSRPTRPGPPASSDAAAQQRARRNSPRMMGSLPSKLEREAGLV